MKLTASASRAISNRSALLDVGVRPMSSVMAGLLSCRHVHPFHAAVGKEYYKLANTDVAKKLIQKEVDILKPKTVVACGTWWPAASLLSDCNCRMIRMNHPGARKSSRAMLQELKAQLG